jgi:hypothetical protein
MPLRRLSPIIAAALLSGACPPVGAGVVLDLAVDSPPTVFGSVPGEEFGYSLAAGDIDGDGRLDLVVGAPGHEAPGIGPHTGAVYVLSAASVVDTAGPFRAQAIARLVLTGTGARSRFGQTLAVGDLNGDTVDDLVIGAPAWGGDDAIASGSVQVYFGGARSDTFAARTPDLTLTGAAPGDRLGSFLAITDVDSDGASELVAAAHRARAPGGARSGVIYVVPGSAIFGAEGERGVADVATTLIVGNRDDDGLCGVVIADLNGDGAAEVVVTADFADGARDDEIDVGRAYALPAAAVAEGGTVSVAERALFVFSGRSPRGLLGSSLAMGDVDLDGIDDLILSAPAARPEGVKLDAWGEAFLVFGRREGFPWSNDLPGEAAISFLAASRWDLFGLPVIAGDFNGDRADDIVIAAQFADPPDARRRRCGEVCVYWGSLRSVMDAKSGGAEQADLTIVGGEEMESIGGALLAAPITGGRTPDLLIGVPEGRGASDGDERSGRLYVVPRERLLARPSARGAETPPTSPPSR